jgi:hypothetical protein
MSDLQAPAPVSLRFPGYRGVLAALALGGAYWLAVLLALEPGNLLRAAEIGRPLPFGPEAARIAGASLLGAASAPVVLLLARGFPVWGERRWRNAAVQALGLAAVTVGLIVLSCLAAALGPFDGSSDVAEQLAENGLLVALCLVGLAAAAHARRSPLQTATPRHTAEIRVMTRRGLVVVPCHRIDWIETQGNYLALHVGPDVHLIRETLSRLEQRLDPEHFARVHRRTVVALDRVRVLRPLPGGDAELRLADGTALRLSRNYRRLVQPQLGLAASSVSRL